MSGSVWTVESGEYSDYRVHAVFSSKELAIEILEAAGVKWTDDPSWGYNDRIVERPLDPETDLTQRGYELWYVRLDRSGEVDDCRLRGGELDASDLFDDERLAVWRSNEISGYVVARSKKHAIKIANDYRARAIAEGRL